MSGEVEPGDDVVSRARYRLRLLRAPESTSGRRLAVGILFAVSVLIVVLNVTVGSTDVPSTAQVIPLVLGGLLLAPRPLTVVFGFVLVAYVLQWTKAIGNNDLHTGAFIVLVIVSLIAFVLSRDRQRLGLSVGRGEQMLFELHDRLLQQSQAPALPDHWRADVALETAGGSEFGGDFSVWSLDPSGQELQFAIVDVSGKGIDAASRALMLSGALGGLLGAVPSADFLSAANGFLVAQRWAEGFATAMHVSVDLTTGHYRVSNAGHLPAIHYRGGAGRWELVEPAGTVLGILPDGEFGHVEGELGPHDALMLYTDGIVEVPGRDLSVGIDRLIGASERLLAQGFEGGARTLISDAAPTGSDDRALLLLWRS